MDDHADKRIEPLIGVSRHGFCLLPGDLNHQQTRSHSSIGTGGTKITAVKSGWIENGEQGESSRGSQHLSSRMSMLQKSASTSPKLGASRPLSSRKMSQSQNCSIALGRWSSTCNTSAGLAQLRQNGPTFQRGVDYRPNSSGRLGPSETSNFTASDRSSRNFDFFQKAMTSSLSRSFLSCNSSVEKMEIGMPSGTVFNREGSWSGLDPLNVNNDLLNPNNRLPDIAHRNEEHRAWTGAGNDWINDLGVGPSTMPMRTVLMNDAESQLIDFRSRDIGSRVDDSFVALDSMAEDLFEQSSISSSESLFHSNLMVNQRFQEQISLRRRTVDHGDHSTMSLGGAVSVTRPFAFKGKSFMPGTASQSAGQRSQPDIFSAGYASIVGGSPSVETRASPGRHNLGMSGCTSGFDSPRSTLSSNTREVSEKPRKWRSVQGRSISEGQDSARVQKLAEGSVASSSGRVLSQRNVFNRTGVLPHHHNLLSTGLPPYRASRRTISETEPNTWCSHRVLGGETFVESELGSSSSCTGICASDQPLIPFNGLQGLDPPSLRGGNSIRALQRRNDTKFGAANTSGQSLPNRHARRTSRYMSSNSPSGKLVGSLGLDSRLNRNPDLTGSLDNLLLEDDISNNTSIVSSVAPLRSPPLPPVVQFSGPQGNSSFSVSLPLPGAPSPQVTPPMPSAIAASFASAVDTSPFGVFDSSVFGGSTSVSEIYGRPTVPYSEDFGWRSLQLRSNDSENSENQSGSATNGLGEVLLALERIEQNEVLTYEQLLVLEETLSFGGISLHDQHSAMRLDIDNMSYEELLALEEQIGDVSTGLDEETISKCLEKIPYSPNTAVVSNTQEIEMKCSICQEEYEERDYLGRLECGHSYHEACIKLWLAQKNKCPICKVSVAS